MSFDRRIFKYPAVEYIPLYPLTMFLEPNWGPPDQSVSLQVFKDNNSFAAELKRLNLVLAPTVDFSHKLILLTLGYEITSAYYRAYTTILQGMPLPGGYHVAAVPCGYFYKDRIHFVLYSDKAAKLAWVNIRLQ
ncbi:MAG: hypothetical protein GX952_05410 [Firmicutes bacterium]|nr:hypothetical protein [Bacillota bacterium]